MKSSCAYLAASLLTAAVSGLGINQKRDDGKAVVGLDIYRRDDVVNPVEHDRLRRMRKRDTLQLSLDNYLTLYFANVTLGTPAQSLRLHIDTGSSDIWTNSASSRLCSSQSGYCAASGTYSANKSSTYQYLNSAFQIKYADGSYAIGDYAADTLTMGKTSIDSVPFGIGYSSTSSQGILGIGYKTNVAAVGTLGKTYNNLPVILADNKVTNSIAYSLWLNDLDANTGSILFGGVDTDKFSGSLQSLPIIKENNIYQEFVIALTEVKAKGSSMSTQHIPVLLDSGSSLTYLPSNLSQAIFSKFSAQYSSDAGTATVDCSLRNSKDSVEFSFSGVSISVTMDELVLTESIRRGKETCILGISDAGDSTSVLGDTFLRSAYVVYDLSNNRISLAPTRFNSTTSNVQEITTGTNSVPGASVVANAVSSLPVSTGGARSPGFGSSASAPQLLSDGVRWGSWMAAAAVACVFML